MWYHANLLILIQKEKINKNKNKNKNEKWNKNNSSSPSLTLTLPPFQGFYFRETNIYFHQFFSNFFRYLFLNFPSSYLYNIFTIYFSSNSSFLKSFSSIISNFSCFLISALSLTSNSTTIFFAFSKSSSFFYIFFSI